MLICWTPAEATAHINRTGLIELQRRPSVSLQVGAPCAVLQSVAGSADGVVFKRRGRTPATHLQIGLRNARHGYSQETAKRTTVDHLHSGGGPGIRTPKSVTRSWISSSNGSCPHHVVVGRHRYLSCPYETRLPG